MHANKRSIVLPVLLISVGTGWLLGTLGIAPNIDWVWTLGLAVLGVLTFLVGGVDKFTIVIGPFFLVAGCLSILRQTGRLPVDVEVPTLVIVAGVLLLVARSAAIPIPEWSRDPHESR